MFVIYADPEDERWDHIAHLLQRRGKSFEFRSTGEQENLRFLYEEGHEFLPQVYRHKGEELEHIGGHAEVKKLLDLEVSKIEW